MGAQVEYHGVGFLPLLALLFIGLKLGGVIAWSWWLVLSPLWVPLAVVLALWAFAALVFLGADFLKGR